jgi:N-terminal domain of anti-restriction factor ArdC
MDKAKHESALEGLERATTGQTLTNYPAIFEGFMAKGIAEGDIKPRENVFTFQAWKALGRSVKKGEHGVKVVTFIECSGRERDPARARRRQRPIAGCTRLRFSTSRKPSRLRIVTYGASERTTARRAVRHGQVGTGAILRLIPGRAPIATPATLIRAS